MLVDGAVSANSVFLHQSDQFGLRQPVWGFGLAGLQLQEDWKHLRHFTREGILCPVFERIDLEIVALFDSQVTGFEHFAPNIRMDL